MTLGGQHDMPGEAHGMHAAAAAQDSKRQRRTMPPAEQPAVIDLASQSSLDLCSPPPARICSLREWALGLDKDSSGHMQDSSAAAGTEPAVRGQSRAAARAAAAGYKRLWGEMAGDDVALVGSVPPPPQASSAAAAAPGLSWGSTRPRARRTRPPAADAAANMLGSSPIVIQDTDDSSSPATLSNNMKQQLHLQQQHSRVNRRAGTPVRINPSNTTSVRPLSITPNPSFSSTGSGPAGAAAAAAAPAAVQRRRNALRLRAPAAAAAGAAAVARAAAAGPRHTSNSNSSSSSADLVDVDAELARKLMQEEEDRVLAQRLMQEEERAVQARMAANRHELEALQAAAAAAAASTAAAAAGSGGRRGHRASYRVPPSASMPRPGYDLADTALFQQPAAAAARRDPNPPQPPARHHHQQQLQQLQDQQRRQVDVSQAMAHMLMSMPLPRWAGGRASGGSGARRGLPASLLQMREAVLGMQRAGLPPQLLFSDRDFTADDYELLCRLDETVENRKGATSTTIEALPTQTVPPGGLLGASGERLSCAVCLEEYAEGAELRSLPCLHKFHKGCIDTWLHQKSACPVCNRDCTQ